MAQRSASTAGTGNLVETLAGTLRDLIRSGELQPKDKLPTEAELAAQFNISRTVVREAVAGLRADGLVESRQGAGTFVLAAPVSRFGLMNSSNDPMDLSTAIETLELRAAVEIEAAGLAASRRSPAQLARIKERFADIEAAVERKGAAAKEDYEFHMSIAKATNNPRFVGFLADLGTQAIPRARINPGGAVDMAYLKQIQDEHRAILDGITTGNPDVTREAMRKHLKGSESRYGQLLQVS